MQNVMQTEQALTQEFVSPKYATELHHSGLTDNVPYFWLEGEDNFHINSFHFDPDDYYRPTFKLILESKSIKSLINFPAYRLTELERIIPGYSITKQNGQYHIMLSTEYGNIEAQSQRMPDAFANLLLQMLKARIINIDYANQQFIINKLHDR